MTSTIPVRPAPSGPPAPVPSGSSPAESGISPGPHPARAAARRWRGPLAVIAAIIVGGTIVALLQPSAGTSGYLDPGDAHSYGARALATLLAERGTAVTRVTTVAAASAAAQAAQAARASQATHATAPAALLVTSPELLTVGQLRSLAQIPGDRVIVGPDPAVLAALAPRVTAVREIPAQPVAPACGLPAARLAGPADMGGLAMTTTAPGAQRCYPAAGYPSLIQYRAGGRHITVLGTDDALANAGLARLGNAALMLNLLGDHARVVWLVPSPLPPASGAAGGQEPFTSVVPWAAYLVAIQLIIAAALAAVWRGRRLGPVVAERLPVVVRAAETVEGHGRLYQARRSRDRAAAALREAARGRILRSLGRPGDPDTAAVAAMLAARTGRSPDEVTALLAGPPPADDAALVTLADGLDALEREVRNP
jgi:hypothetical protein